MTINRYLKLLKSFIYYFYRSLIFKTIYLKFIEALIIFFVSLLLIRLLGPSDYGKLNYIFSFVFILQPIYIFGTPAVMQAKLTRKKDSLVIINQLFTIEIVLFVITSFFSILIFKNIFITENLNLFLILQLSFGFRIFNILTQSLFIFKKGVESVKISVFSAIKLLILISIPLRLELGLYFIGLAYLINYITDLVIIFLILRNNRLSHLFLKIKFDFSNLSENIQRCLPIAASGFISIFLLKFDVILIKYFMDEFSAGIYSAPALYVVKINVFLSLITLNLVPKLKDELNKNIDKETMKLFTATWIFSFLASLSFYILSPYIINIGFGEEYKDSLKLIPLLSLNIFFNGFLLTANSFLNFYNFENIIFYKSLITITINITLNLLLIPIFGLQGVLLSSLFSTTFNAFSGFLFNKKLKKHLRAILLPNFKNFMRDFV